MKNGWVAKPFESCIERVEYTRKIQRKDFLREGQFPIVSQEADFTNGYWNDEEDVFRVSKPVVIFGDHTQVLKYVDFDFVLGADGVKILQPRDFLDPKFFFYCLQAATVESLGYARHYRLLKDLEMRIPPLPEQRRIVGILDAVFDGISKAKANTETNLKNARTLFESKRYSAFANGEGWAEKTLDEIAENLDSQRVPITKAARRSGEFPYYGASGVVDHVADYIFDGEHLLVSEDGANLLMRSTPIAFSVSGKCWVNNHAHILKFAHPATQEFVRLYLNSISLDDYVTGAAQPKLTQAALNSIPIPIPSDVGEQQEMVDALGQLASQSTSLESIYTRKLAAIDSLKKSIFHQAFTGGL